LRDPTVDAWPHVLARMLNADLTNDAISGGTNQRTVYRTIKNSSTDYDLYLVAWTTITRFTFYKSDNNFEINFNPQLSSSLYQNESYYKDWGKTLYAQWYNELYAFKLWLQQVIQLQSVLSNKKMLMINTFDNNLELWSAPIDKFIEKVKLLINHDIMTDKQILDEYYEIQYYISLIDKSKFYKWNVFSIRDLCKEFPISKDRHILEAGNHHLAELLYNHLCSK
jgi:hypothetical protein